MSGKLVAAQVTGLKKENQEIRARLELLEKLVTKAWESVTLLQSRLYGEKTGEKPK